MKLDLEEGLRLMAEADRLQALDDGGSAAGIAADRAQELLNMWLADNAAALLQAAREGERMLGILSDVRAMPRNPDEWLDEVCAALEGNADAKP